MSLFLSYLLLFAFSPGLCFLVVLLALASGWAWVCLLAAMIEWVVKR